MKDLNQHHLDDEIEEDHAIIMTDVDYRVDMPEFLATIPFGNPLLLYTFAPSHAGHSTETYQYSFKDNKLVFDVAGGAHYRHRLWDYEGDIMTNFMYGLTWERGLYFQHRSYLLERKRVSEHHSIVALLPYAELTGILALLTRFVFSMEKEKDLARFEPRVVLGESVFNRFVIHNDDGFHVTLSREGETSHTTIPKDLFETLTMVRDNSARPVSAGMLQKWARGTGCLEGQEPRDIQPILSYLRAVPAAPQMPQVTKITDPAGYTFGTPPDTEDPTPMVSFMPPLVDATAIPLRTLDNDKQTVQTRIVSPGQHKLATPYMIREMTTFINYLMADMEAHGTAFPLTLAGEEAVRAKQTRPTQVIKIESAVSGPICLDEEVKQALECFMKIEAYGKYNDPRNITTFGNIAKYLFGTIIYPIHEAMHGLPWFIFGRTPAETAKFVGDLCSRSDMIVGTDYSRFDATIGAIFRMMEAQLVKRMFGPDRALLLQRVLRAHYRREGRTSFGVRFFTGFTRGSGSMATCAFNSLANALCGYMAYRDAGFEPAQAYGHLGLYGGDDGLNGNLAFKHLDKAAGQLGLTVKCEGLWLRGDPGVCMLARLYSQDVWLSNGSVPNSCHDILRAATKLHNGGRRGKPSGIDGERVLEKMYSVLATDANTPLTGTLARVLVGLAELDPEWSVPKSFRGSLRDISSTLSLIDSQIEAKWTPGKFGADIITDDWSWYARQSFDDKFKNFMEEWMIDILDDLDLEGFYAWIASSLADKGQPGSFLNAIKTVPTVGGEGPIPHVTPVQTNDPDAPPEPIVDVPEINDDELREEDLIELEFPYLQDIDGTAPFDPDFPSTFTEDGQGKLYSHEARFLQNIMRQYKPSSKRPRHIVYAGAHHGYHLEPLIRKFQAFKFHLFDPAFTKARLKALRNIKHKSKRICTVVHAEKFDPTYLDKFKDGSVLLISDIWERNKRDEMMDLQNSWTSHSALWGYSLKFLPAVEKYEVDSIEHPPGRHVLQTHVKGTCGETRLVCYPNIKAAYTSIDMQEYCGKLAYWQQTVRSQKWETKWALQAPKTS
jgi:hypothetical protein